MLIPETNISLTNLADFIKSRLGKSDLFIKLSVIADESGKGYIVQSIAKYDSNFSHISTSRVQSIDQVEDALTLLTLKYVNPAIYASLVFDTSPEDAEESISIALDNLDEYQKNSSLTTLIGYLHLNSNKLANRHANLIKAKVSFEKAIKLNRNDDLALLGKSYTNISLAEMNRPSQADMKAIADAEISNLNSLILKNNKNSDAYILLAANYLNINEKSKVIKTFENALKVLQDDPNLLSSYITYLVSIGKSEEADKVLNRAYLKLVSKITKNNPTLKNSYPMQTNEWKLHYLKLNSLLRNNKLHDIPLYTNLINNCGLSLWLTDAVVNYRADKNSVRKRQLGTYIESQMFNAERRGVEGFRFYSSWGDFLLETNEMEEALKKYKKALEYPGEKTWALINVASIYINKNDFIEAEKFAYEALSFGVIEAAVNNYLSAISGQNEYKRYIREYTIWNYALPDKMKLSFLTLRGVSECKLGKKEEAEETLDTIYSELAGGDKYSRFKSNKDKEVERTYIGQLKSCLNI